MTDVEAALAGYAGVAQAAMRDFLAAREPSAYLYELVREYPARGGKGLRPALLLATCLAYGGTLQEGLDAAVAIEMLHNAFLIHDDLQDESERRRGRPTLHALHGVPLAVNAGDALATLAIQPLLGPAHGPRLARRMLEEMLDAIIRTTEGQALELGWRRDNVVDLGPADYLELVAKKTCCYTTVAPLRLGALIGSRGSAPLEPLTRFGFHLGAAFQIRDDLLSLEGGAGKDALGDIREGKRTLMLLHLLGTPERAWLAGFLGAPERSDDDVARVRAAMDEHGSLDYARAYAESLAQAAAEALDEAFADLAETPHSAFVRALVPYMLARSA